MDTGSVAFDPIVSRNPYLDQLVRGQSPIDFSQRCSIQSLGAEQYDRLERVGSGFQRLALLGSQFECCHVRIRAFRSSVDRVYRRTRARLIPPCRRPFASTVRTPSGSVVM